MCGDVRPVLREVFQDLDGLPPLELITPDSKNLHESGDCKFPQINKWAENYTSECKDIWKKEIELQNEYAKRLSRRALPNIYKICCPKPSKDDEAEWRRELGVIKRKDFIPTIVQNSGRDVSLWIKNIFNRSSGDMTTVEPQLPGVHKPIYLSSPAENTIQSLSIGDVMVHPRAVSSPEPVSLPQPQYILCVPPQLDFVNFTVGQLYTQSLRLVNVSKFEIRLSIRPPSRRELDVELCGTRGLTVTSGSAAELKVHFRPRDVRVLRDTLQVRVSLGKPLLVPIACYMQPPLLEIMVLGINGCLSEGGNEYEAISTGSEVLDLGAKLLGDIHEVHLQLRSDAGHASFFILSEDAWLSFTLEGLTTDGSVVSGDFAMSPAWWRGGGTVQGCLWCVASQPGVHTAKFLILCSTAITRPLNVIADSLYFSTDHITIEGHEKDYDICSEDDPDCEYYVHLGTAFPQRTLSATVKIINHSPVTYSYHWTRREWGVCSCWDQARWTNSSGSGDEDRLCAGALHAKQIDDKKDSLKWEKLNMLRVEPEGGQIAARSSCAIRISAADVGPQLEVHRAVLMLILEDVPKKSFPENYKPNIVSTKSIESETIPGVKIHQREVCEVVCCQLEVWWEVVPLRFVLDPSAIPLYHSGRVRSVDVTVRATQLYGREAIEGAWHLPNGVPQTPPSTLTPSSSCSVTLTLPLPISTYQDTDLITLTASNEEWESRCSVNRQCTTRQLGLRPAIVWLGVVPPGTRMHAELEVINDTHQRMSWSGETFTWCGENASSSTCVSRPPCGICHEKICSCAFLRPTEGSLSHGETDIIHYQVNAPEMDGCVVSLVQVKGTGVQLRQSCGGRSSLVAFRVLAPRLVMRVTSCRADNNGCCNDTGSRHGCSLDEGTSRSARGSATLRPSSALCLGTKTCYRLKIRNLTPLPTVVQWETPIDGAQYLHAIFLPKRFNVKGYGEVEIRLVLGARKVSRRRLFVVRAQVEAARRPLWLIVDAAINGLEVTCEIPIGDELKTDSFVVIRRSDREDYPWEGEVKPSTPDEIFENEDRKRAKVQENLCGCKFEMVYIPPKKPAKPPSGLQDCSSIELVCEPAPLTRVCSCATSQKPNLPEEVHPCCLQFRGLSLRTVLSRTLILRNHSVLTSRWSTAIRRWQRQHKRTINPDQWADDVCDPGVVLQCTPSSGVLASKAHIQIDVQVYADSWGVFHDQILIQMDHIEPIVLDVWIEAIGPPLRFAIKPTDSYLEDPPILWMSATDPERTLQVKNVSRAELDVQAYVFTENENLQDAEPFRLYLRFYDIPVKTCPCFNVYKEALDGGESISEDMSYIEEMGTGVEIFLAPDYGVQRETCFKVSPEMATLAAGMSVEWKVKLETPLHYELAPSCNLVLRALPKDRVGKTWYRPDPSLQVVNLKQVERNPVVKVSCEEVRVQLCALDLPHDVIRVRKRFRLLNIGNGPQLVNASTQHPWSIVLNKEHHPLCGAGCMCPGQVDMKIERREIVPFNLEPRSSIEMCVEVVLEKTELKPIGFDSADPCKSTSYPEFKISKTPLVFYDDDNVILKLPLILEVEYPKLIVEPTNIEFGFVTDGDTRKTYLSMSHSSRNASLVVTTEFYGGEEFKIWPPFLHLPPNTKKRIYVQYTSVWSIAPAEGFVHLRAGCSCNDMPSWCQARVPCRASPTRDHKWKTTTHDHTDDTHLLPPDIIL